MIVNRKPLTFWERLYLPAIAGGLKVTFRHAWRTLFQGKAGSLAGRGPALARLRAAAGE